MKTFHHVTISIASEQQRAEFLEAGVKLPRGLKMPRGRELLTFDIAEHDPRWEKVTLLIKKFKAFDLVRAKPASEKSANISSPNSQSLNLDWLDECSGQSVEQLLSLEEKYRIDSLVLAFEQAIQQKAAREGDRSLTGEERVVLAVEALEREVNNGGYDQFFRNSSLEFIPTIVECPRRIGCTKTAKKTQRAIRALSISGLTPEIIESAMVVNDVKRETKLSHCDDSYNSNPEPSADRLFDFIKANKTAFKL